MTRPARIADPVAPAGIEIAAPRTGDLARVVAGTGAAPFAEDVLDFVAALSRAILTGRQFRAYPELVAFAHWMRKRNLLDMKARFEAETAGRFLTGRGLALHIAPANVDTIFLYSVLLSLMAGNANVVRVSSRRSEQIEVLIGQLDEVLSRPEHAAVAERMMVVRYPRDEAINAWLSARADLRVVWGGDASIMAMRAIPARPHTKDVSFPDRWSLAVLDAAALLAEDETALERMIGDFVNDTYWFGQLACSSPRMVLWRGDEATAEAASERFWTLVEDKAARFRDELFAVDYVNKLIAGDEMAIGHQARAIRVGRSNVVGLVRLAPGALPDMDMHTGAGLFFEGRIDTLDALAARISRKTQTVVSHGIGRADWEDFLVRCRPHGIDRIVPVGAALDFAAVWDGMDLLREFTRETTLSV